MTSEMTDSAAAKLRSADVNTTAARPLPAYRADDAAGNPIYLGIALLIAGLAALCLWAFMDASLLASSARTRLDLPASACPTPKPGQQLVITVHAANGDITAASCRTVTGRAA